MTEAARPEDRRLMGLALALGDRHRGRTWPNPSVGAVVADEAGRIVAAGITQPGGRPHAERLALAESGEAARGATLYVSLEPCAHHGRTPPCAEAVIASGVARVVTAIEDPDPRVAGRGHAMLEAAGIVVTAGLRREEAAESHRGHISRVTRGRPWLTLKLARTPNGFAGVGGRRLRITSEGADGRTHMLRARADAVLVGLSTILADDPGLDVRLPGMERRSPVRLVADTHLRLPPASRLARSAAERATWILCGEAAAEPAASRLRGLGAEILRSPVGPDGRIDLRVALASLAERGLTSILCEGGPALAEALAEADLVDELVLVTGGAPLDPGAAGIPALGPALRLALASRFSGDGAEEVGPDRIERFGRTRCSRDS